MYKRPDKQMRLEDFVFPYGKLNAENDWVKLSSLIPWRLVEERYSRHFVDNGHPAHPARMALGALIIKQRLNCSDDWTVRHVSENPYLQYFLGMKEYRDACPFGASTMVAFRKRFSEADIAEILEMTIPRPSVPPPREPNDDEPPNGGTLIMDATCCPADIAYPQDIELLNDTRVKLEAAIHEVCKENGLKKPRTYCKRARKDYLRLVKSKKRTGKQIRTALRKQLQYIRRDIGYIVKYVRSGIHLSPGQYKLLNLLTTVYEQQLFMYETKTHSVPHRIVSVSQPHIRPVPRGKARVKTEFGAKLHISMVDGYARMERLDFETYNEAGDFFRILAGYRQRYGRYPERILADRIYRNRDTLQYCKKLGIRLTGPALGRPPQNVAVARDAKRQEYQDICDRNAIEGKFGTGKTAYGLNRIAARLETTSRCVIGIALLVMNLIRRLNDPEIFLYFFLWLHGLFGYWWNYNIKQNNWVAE